VCVCVCVSWLLEHNFLEKTVILATNSDIMKFHHVKSHVYKVKEEHNTERWETISMRIDLMKGKQQRAKYESL